MSTHRHNTIKYYKILINVAALDKITYMYKRTYKKQYKYKRMYYMA